MTKKTLCNDMGITSNTLNKRIKKSNLLELYPTLKECFCLGRFSRRIFFPFEEEILTKKFLTNK